MQEMPREFSIEKARGVFDASKTFIPVPFTMAKAIETAVENSRSYQSERESLYLQALSLTSSRHEFDPIFFGSASGDILKDTAGETSIASVLSTGVSKMLETGADLSLSLTTNLFRYISAVDPAETASSAIKATLSQPLLESAGRKVTLENLTQAERNMVYAIRDFVRYRKSFSVGIAKDYLNLLQVSDEVENASRNYDSLKFVLERAQSMAEAGRLPAFEVDQAEQNALQARDSWIRAIERYERALDDFKIDLGLPTDLVLEPDNSELDRLREKGIAAMDMTVEEACKVALDERLDLKNTIDSLEDAERKVDVARSYLKPRLDLILTYSAYTNGSKKPVAFGNGTNSYGAGLDFELPLDKKSQRNSYRSALIGLDAVRRDYARHIDLVKQDIRDALRTLDQSEQSYRIQKISSELAERRVESTKILHKAGRVTTRDILDAEEDLLSAKNSLTGALIDNFNARLDLFLAMETLRVNEKGLWSELAKQTAQGKTSSSETDTESVSISRTETGNNQSTEMRLWN